MRVSADDQNEVVYNDMAMCSVKALSESHNLFICVGSAICYRES